MTGRQAETVLAFDFGLKRIGVAVGSRLTGGAQPLATIAATSDAQRFDRIAALIGEWQPQRLVVGRPTHPDGLPLPVTARCERFARQLHGRFGLPVHLVDENYSSVEADREAAGEDWGLPAGGIEGGAGGAIWAGKGGGGQGGKRSRDGGRDGGEVGGGRGAARMRRSPPAAGGRRTHDDARAAAIILRQYWSDDPPP